MYNATIKLRLQSYKYCRGRRKVIVLQTWKARSLLLRLDQRYGLLINLFSTYNPNEEPIIGQADQRNLTARAWFWVAARFCWTRPLPRGDRLPLDWSRSLSTFPGLQLAFSERVNPQVTSRGGDVYIVKFLYWGEQQQTKIVEQE